jgi:hypothetical protein
MIDLKEEKESKEVIELKPEVDKEEEEEEEIEFDRCIKDKIVPVF